MRTSLKDKVLVDLVYQQFKYDLGLEACQVYGLLLAMVCLLISWLAIKHTERQLFRGD